MKKAEAICKFTYVGPLSDALTGYIAQKKAVGYEVSESEHAFVGLDRFTIEQDCDKNILDKRIAETWTSKRPNEKPVTQFRRIYLMRRLAQYMQAYGYDAYLLPKPSTRHNSPNYIPYIFNNDELRRMFNYFDNLIPRTELPRRHLVIPAVFRTMYTCGLRLNETLELKVHDIDLESAVITVRHSKFDKDRLVPITSELANILRYYKVAVHISKMDVFFFPSDRGGRYGKSTIYNVFRNALWDAGISHGGKGKGPRVQDLRHSFAVHCLRKWMSDGKDINIALPYLSAYLGHTSYAGTQYYLRLTADVFPSITSLMDNNYGSIYPSGGDEE